MKPQSKPKPTNKQQIVPRHSAFMEGYSQVSIHADHMSMTKFADDNAPGFKQVSGHIMRWCRKYRHEYTLSRAVSRSFAADNFSSQPQRAPVQSESDYRQLAMAPAGQVFSGISGNGNIIGSSISDGSRVSIRQQQLDDQEETGDDWEWYRGKSVSEPRRSSRK